MQTVLVFFLMISFVLDIIFVIFATTRKDSKRSIYFTTFTACIFIYSLGYLLEILSTTPESAMTALIVENAGIPVIAPFFFITTLSLFKERYLKTWMISGILFYGAIIFGCVFTNNYHHLYYSSVEMVYNGTSYYLSLGKGPIYIIQQIVSITFLFITYGVLLQRFVTGGKKLQNQMIYYIFGSFLGFSGNILNLSGVIPSGVDPTPFAITIGVGIVLIDVMKYKLLDIVSISSNMAIESMDDSVIVLESDWCFLFCNKSAKMLFPSLGKFLGMEPVSQAEGWPPELLKCNEAGQVTFNRRNEESGAISTYRANISKINSRKGKLFGWSIVIRDITDLTQLMKQLEQYATIDPLTNIFNRRHFINIANSELVKAKRQNIYLGLIIYDLDDFKKVNDTYGHAAGDYVLSCSANAVKSQLRSYDVFARYGGEEFVIFTPCDNMEGFISFATRLCNVIRECEIVYEGINIPITASFGAVQIPPGQSLDTAMLEADKALYRAKDKHRGQVVMGEVKDTRSSLVPRH